MLNIKISIKHDICLAQLITTISVPISYSSLSQDIIQDQALKSSCIPYELKVSSLHK